MKIRRFKRDDKNQQNSAYFTERRPVELIEELEAKVNAATDEDLDVTMVQAYLSALQEKAPVLADFNPQQSLHDFKEKHSALFNDGAGLKKPHKSRDWFFKIASVACVLLLTLTITANAYGVNVVEKVVEWGSDILRIGYRESHGAMELPADSQSEFLSMADAFQHYGIPSGNCPTWIPERFSLSEIVADDGDGNIVLLGVYQDGAGNELSFFANYNSKGTEMTTIEKDEGGYSYIKDGKEYYLMTNRDVEQAAWLDGYALFTLYGDVSEQEMKQIIDSIPEK